MCVIDRTTTPHGKARPWLLLATPLMIVSAILAVAVPNAPAVVQLIWGVFTYCLFTDMAFSVWGTAHNLMVPWPPAGLRSAVPFHSPSCPPSARTSPPG